MARYRSSDFMVRDPKAGQALRLGPGAAGTVSLMRWAKYSGLLFLEFTAYRILCALDAVELPHGRMHLTLTGLVVTPAPSIHVNERGRGRYGLACSKARGSYLLCSRGWRPRLACWCVWCCHSAIVGAFVRSTASPYGRARLWITCGQSAMKGTPGGRPTRVNSATRNS